MTLQQCVGDKKRASRHHSERNKERHPVIRLAPEDHATDKETDQRRHDGENERECGIAADRETKLLHCLCGVRGGCTRAHVVPVHTVWSCAKYEGRRTTKIASVRITRLTHATLAMRSQRPYKRVSAWLYGSMPPVVCVAKRCRFIHGLLLKHPVRHSNAKK